MAIGLAELHQAIVSNWTLSVPLRDGGAQPGDGFPYVVMAQSPSIISYRTSGAGIDTGKVRRGHDVPWEFRCYAVESGTTSAKQAAANVAEDVMAIYGGHPDQAATAVVLSSGEHLISQLLSEYPVRTDENEHMWVLQYNFKVDLPVKV